MAEKIARYYNAAANPDEASLPGVPLADLTEADYDAQPEHVQRAIDASPFYRKSRPRPAADSDAADDAAPQEG